MKPIWYFVGIMLLLMGGLVLISGLYQLANPPEGKTVLAETHPSIWWGAVMVTGGGILFLRSRKQSV
jgi:hypothetical protein